LVKINFKARFLSAASAGSDFWGLYNFKKARPKSRASEKSRVSLKNRIEDQGK
jgi:hypothetical protein